MPMILRSIFGIFCIALMNLAWGGDPQALIQKMNQAMVEQSYKGTLVYSANGQLEVIRVIRRNTEQGLRERIFTLTGTQREILRDKGKVRCLLPNDRSLEIESQWAEGLFPEFDLERWKQTRKYYRYSLKGRDRIADRETEVLDITPNNSDRYGYRLWIDLETGLLLKSSLNDHQSRALQQIVFTEIEIGSSISDEELSISQPDGKYLNLPVSKPARRAATEQQPLWYPEYLPKGFKLQSHQRLPRKALANNVGEQEAQEFHLEHSVYSDGLASFSLYIEGVPGTGDEGAAEFTRGGTVIIARRKGDYLITAVGELPPKSLKKILSSVRLKSSEPLSRVKAPQQPTSGQGETMKVTPLRPLGNLHFFARFR